MADNMDMYEAIAKSYPRAKTEIYNFDAHGVHSGLPKEFGGGLYIRALLQEVAKRSDPTTLNIIYTDGTLDTDPKNSGHPADELSEMRNVQGYTIFTSLAYDFSYLESQLQKYGNVVVASIM